MTRRTSRNWLLAGVTALLVAALAMAWHAGGPEQVREVSVPVAVPELAE